MTWFSIVLLAVAALFVWYVANTESYIDKLEQQLKSNGIKIKEDRYGFERK